MASRNRKQPIGVYERLNSETQLWERRNNRAMRRRNIAQARKRPGEFRKVWKENRLHQTVKASSLYSR